MKNIFLNIKNWVLKIFGIKNKKDDNTEDEPIYPLW
jgi:hypothetical protein